MICKNSTLHISSCLSNPHWHFSQHHALYPIKNKILDSETNCHDHLEKSQTELSQRKTATTKGRQMWEHARADHEIQLLTLVQLLSDIEQLGFTWISPWHGERWGRECWSGSFPYIRTHPPTHTHDVHADSRVSATFSSFLARGCATFSSVARGFRKKKFTANEVWHWLGILFG